MKKIRNKLLLYFLIISIIPIIIMGISVYQLTSRETSERIRREIYYSTHQIGKNVETRMDQVEKYMFLLFTNKDIQRFVGQYDFRVAHLDSFAGGELSDTFSYYFEGERNLLAAVLFDWEGGEYIYRNRISRDISPLRQTDWFTHTQQSDGQNIWVGSEKTYDRFGVCYNTFSVARVIKDLANNRPLQPIGIVYLSFSEELFNEIYQDGIGESTVTIADKDGYIISHSDKNLIGTNIAKEGYYLQAVTGLSSSGVFDFGTGKQQQIISYYRIPDLNWMVIKATPYAQISSQLKPIAGITLLLCLLVFAGASLAAAWISRRISQPLRELNEAMRQVEEGNFDIQIMPGSQDEIGMIRYRFNIMTQRIDEFFTKAIEQEKQKNQEQLRALQYQVNPHFLYNTLSTIRLMAIFSGCSNIRLACEALVRMLRSASGKTGEMVPITTEIENIRDYIYIQQIKNDGKIQVDYHIPLELHNCFVPYFILQPIVENAIFHGLEPRMEAGGCLRIAVEQRGSDLLITVSDDGVGMSQENIQRLFTSSPPSGTMVKIGVANVDKRIKLRYGDEYGVQVTSEVGAGTVVSICLPIVKGEIE